MLIDFSTIITSAAVGGIAGSVISFIGTALERRGRRKEMLLSKAIELSIERARFAKEVAKETNRGTSIQDQAVMAATYYRWLEHLLDKGSLPDEVDEIQARDSGRGEK